MLFNIFTFHILCVVLFPFAKFIVHALSIHYPDPKSMFLCPLVNFVMVRSLSACPALPFNLLFLWPVVQHIWIQFSSTSGLNLISLRRIFWAINWTWHSFSVSVTLVCTHWSIHWTRYTFVRSSIVVFIPVKCLYYSTLTARSLHFLGIISVIWGTLLFLGLDRV